MVQRNIFILEITYDELSVEQNFGALWREIQTQSLLESRADEMCNLFSGWAKRHLNYWLINDCDDENFPINLKLFSFRMLKMHIKKSYNKMAEN